MVIKLRNLGALHCASIELADITVVCGKNNTGKTYATYAVFGFLSYWWEAYELEVNHEIISTLLESGNVIIQIAELVRKAQHFVDVACKKFDPLIQRVFSSDQESLTRSTLRIALSNNDIKPLDTYDQTTGSKKVNLFSIHKDTNSNIVTISLLVDKGSIEIPSRVLQRSISFALKKIIFKNTFPNPAILVAERTGIEIFQAELDFARNRLLDTLKDSEGNLDPFEILRKVNTDYAIPINRAVDSVRNVKESIKSQSYVFKEHPDVIQFMMSILGGDVVYAKNSMYYVPITNKRLRLKINESSSSVRSLVDLAIYLKHLAEKGDLLMIDEPELNLHPENQRKVMQLFAMLVQIGIKVYVTTHSDYIVKELNNLSLMRNVRKEQRIHLCEKYGYNDMQMLNDASVSVYVASLQPVLLEGNTRRTKCNTFLKVKNGEFGFELDSFDNTIDVMNEIQDELLYECD